MSDFDGLYNIRPAKESDKNLILSTFLKGLHYGSIDKECPSKTLFFGLIPANIFFSHYKRVIEALVNSNAIVITVACLPDDEDTVLGYSIVSNDGKTLFWVFVKNRWRKHGVAKSLVPNTVDCVAHFNLLGKTLMNKIPNVTFNPFF